MTNADLKCCDRCLPPQPPHCQPLLRAKLESVEWQVPTVHPSHLERTNKQMMFLTQANFTIFLFYILSNTPWQVGHIGYPHQTISANTVTNKLLSKSFFSQTMFLIALPHTYVCKAEWAENLLANKASLDFLLALFLLVLLRNLSDISDDLVNLRHQFSLSCVFSHHLNWTPSESVAQSSCGADDKNQSCDRA